MIGRAAAGVTAVLLAGIASVAQPATGLAALDTDGLYSWRVPAVDGAPAQCCWDWHGGRPVAKGCAFDGARANHGMSPDDCGETETLVVYARIEAGRATRIHAVSPDCPVTAKDPIIDLGDVAAADSVTWLEQAMRQGDNRRDDTVAAIAAHAGPEARDVLLGAARDADDVELRKDAMFWLARLRFAAIEDDVETWLLRDPDPEIREHAAFAIAESGSPRRRGLLVRQGRTDADPDVRSEAWFWLAQTGEQGVETPLRAAIAEDPDDDVREDAVFALSQLPEERAIDALLTVLGDRALDEEIRKQALFWLAQSESARAYDYIDTLLTAH